MSVTDLYNKDVYDRIDIEFIDLEKTGSHDDRCNQVVVLTAPESIARSIRSACRGRKPNGIVDIELVHTDKTQDGETVYELYLGGSYGAGELLGGVGEGIYYAKEVGTNFEGQY